MQLATGVGVDYASERHGDTALAASRRRAERSALRPREGQPEVGDTDVERRLGSSEEVEQGRVRAGWGRDRHDARSTTISTIGHSQGCCIQPRFVVGLSCGGVVEKEAAGLESAQGEGIAGAVDCGTRSSRSRYARAGCCSHQLGALGSAVHRLLGSDLTGVTDLR
mmetsp:Transcript_109600/g.304887  ORF Transcript_109600/g.304887 Transcript_109600/m.304887 type:complete len:166 (-) Transcript_109600:35-532(-)